MLKPLPSQDWTSLHAAHLLNRAGFGGTPAEIASLHAMGLEAAVEALIVGEEETDLFPPPELTQPAESFEFRQRIKNETDPMAKSELESDQRKQQRVEMQALREWWLQRMRYTAWPLREKMTLFWHGHFATSNEKTKSSYLMWQQNETLRANALRSFRQLVKDVSRDPAMMQYLDLQRSSRAHPNENFARELMELFTLGEGVRYTETDVREVARALTGYRVNSKTQQFEFARKQFDPSTKTLLGESGEMDGDTAIDVILQQPECGEFIARKLWRFYVADEPSDDLVRELGARFVGSDYGIGALMKAIFLSEEFYAPGVVRSQVKSPVQWLVQTAKVLESPLPGSPVLEVAMNQMGQMLFVPPNVKGWDGGRAWITSATLLFRFNLAGYLVGGKNSKLTGLPKNPTALPLGKIAPARLRTNAEGLTDALAMRLLNGPLSKTERNRLTGFLIERGDATDDESIRDLLHLIMSTPEYQLI